MTFEDRRAIARRLIARIRMDSATGCWEWTGPKNHRGYGMTTVRGRSMTAHRAAAIAWNDFTPDPHLYILHSCDNPGCINPRHLSADTHNENMRQAWERGRMPTGRRIHTTKLTHEAVVAIRNAYADGEHPRALASAYGVALTTIEAAVTGRHWKHTGGPLSGWRGMANGVQEPEQPRMTSDELRHARRKLGMTQREFAAALGLRSGSAFISHMETERSPVTPRTTQKVQRLLRKNLQNAP